MSAKAIRLAYVPSDTQKVSRWKTVRHDLVFLFREHGDRPGLDKPFISQGLQIVERSAQNQSASSTLLLRRTQVTLYTKNRLVQGVGISDADYVVTTTVNGKRVRCPFYVCWKNMLERCYSEKYQYRRPTYIGCKVIEKWHSFMAFREWMRTQDWEDKELDKDLIGDGKLYSPENCVFVLSKLNLFFIDSGASRGDCPIGVCKRKGKFMSYVRFDGKLKHLGMFPSASEAHAAWHKAKLEIANGFLDNESNPRIRYAIECGIEKLQLGTIAVAEGAL